MNRRLIAVIVDGAGGEDAAAQALALATVTRILEHGGQVLLSADAATRLPAIFAAAEYVAPADVEDEEHRGPPILLAKFPEDDSLEDRLITAPQQPPGDRPEQPPRTLLAELIDAGIVEPLGGGELADVLRSYRPAAVLVIGSSARSVPLQRAAERYHDDEVGSYLLRLDESPSPWPGIEERVRRLRVPPRFEGKVLDEHQTEDELPIVAWHAANDAARVLAIEDAIAEILGDEESILPDDRDDG